MYIIVHMHFLCFVVCLLCICCIIIMVNKFKVGGNTFLPHKLLEALCNKTKRAHFTYFLLLLSTYKNKC